MAKQETGGGQTRATRQDEQTEEIAENTTAKAGNERREKLSDDVDSILDEIDDVLEENAEEFVRGYVQKGGQ